MEAEDEKVGVKARTVLWYLTFVGFAMNYMIRININIAIVDMISAEHRGTRTVMSECFSLVNATNATYYEVSDADVTAKGDKYISLERRLLDFIGVCYDAVVRSRVDLRCKVLLF